MACLLRKTREEGGNHMSKLDNTQLHKALDEAIIKSKEEVKKIQKMKKDLDYLKEVWRGNA
jgi:regulator of replication initiation timing